MAHVTMSGIARRAESGARHLHLAGDMAHLNGRSVHALRDLSRHAVEEGRHIVESERRAVIRFMTHALRDPSHPDVDLSPSDVKLIMDFLGSLAKLPPPAHKEIRVVREAIELIFSRVFYNANLDGNERQVVTIPGFLSTDLSLQPINYWLHRHGFNVHPSGIGVNLLYTDVKVEYFVRKLEELKRRYGRPTILIGHSLGGSDAKHVADARPDLVDHAITFGSPLRFPFGVNPLIGAAIFPAYLVNRARFGELAHRELGYLHSLMQESRVPITSFHSKTDGVLDWRASVRTDPNAVNVEVDSSHLGMVVNRKVYAATASVLREM